MRFDFKQRPLVELLETDREEPDPDFAGVGWARADEIWLGRRRRVTNALVIALHAVDDGPVLDDDVMLQFALPDGGVGQLLASEFLASQAWPHDVSAIVLCLCNPHRAHLTWPDAPAVPIHYAIGNVVAWGDPDGRVRLEADSWRTLRDVAIEVAQPPISDEEKQAYIGMWLLKKLDLKPEDGGMTLPIVLPSELGTLEETLHQLAVDGLVELNTKKERYELTKQGIAYLGELIDEASDLVDEFDDEEMPEVVAELKRRNLDPMRARFLWGWYEGELDDLVRFQEQRGVRPVERMWAFYLTGNELWRELARDLVPE